MKKVIIIILTVVIILIGAIMTLPIIFKDSILEKVKKIINDNVNAKVEFADFKLSFFRSFPKIQAELVDFTMIGMNEFEGDTIAAIKSLSTDISLSDLFGDSDLAISLIELQQAQVNLKVNQNGLANWDIVTTSSDDVVEEVEDATTSDTGINLNSIMITNLNLSYLDETMPMLLKLDDINLNVSGSLKGMITSFEIDGQVKELYVDYDSVNYISNVALALNSTLEADLDLFKFEFKESTFHLNELPINITGGFAMPSDTMTFDVAMEVPQSNFATILALVPADYQQYLEGVTAVGEAGFNGTVKGYMYNEDYPSMDFNLFINDATLQYADMPEKVEKINLAVNINQPQGILDSLTVAVSKAHAEIRNNPIDAKLFLQTPMSDMAFDAQMSANVNFATLKDAIPMDSVNLEGSLNGNVALKGTMSAVEQEAYDKIIANGSVTFQNFIFKSPAFTKAIELTSGSIKISNQAIDMSSFAAKVGNSDFTFNGALSNYLPYFFKNQTLKGKFSLQSSLIDADELMTLMPETEETTATVETPEDSILIFQVPDKLDLTFNSKINKVIFDGMNITNINGLITVLNQKLLLNNLSMDLLGGGLNLDGSYAAYSLDEAEFDFKINLNKFSIPAAYETFSAFQKYMPIAKSTSGNISANLNLQGKLDPTLSMITKTLNGSGKLSTQDIQLAKTATIEKLNQVLKTEKLNNLILDDFTADFKVTNGNFLVEPFNTKIAGQDVTVDGEILADLSMNLGLDFTIKKADLNSSIGDVLNVIPGANKLEAYPIGINIVGDIQNPSVTPDLNKAKDLIAEELKKSAKENAGKVVDEVGNALKNLFGK